jgi:phosphoglycolate phosphatase
MARVLAFDYDGVLVDSYDVFKRYFLIACQEENIDSISSEHDFLSLFDGNLYERMTQQGLSRDQILRIVLTVRDGIIQEQDSIKPFHGIRDMVHELADGNILAVVTSNDTGLVRHFLKTYDMDCFTDILGSDREPSKQAKLQHLRRQHHATCHYIGDTAGDIHEGTKANVTTIAVTWGWHTEQRLRRAAPDHVVHTPGELLALFR